MQPPHILIALDDSEASKQAVSYVAQMLAGQPDVRIRLFHVPAPIPPKLLEFGGRARPEQEQQSEAALQETQEAWRRDVEPKAQSLFAEARSRLSQAQLPDTTVETQICTPTPERELETAILEAAQTAGCDTVVVGRESFSWWREFLHQHVADRLVQRAQGLTLWVVQ
jgi:nucleotide-binding universal stress UspA family protein